MQRAAVQQRWRQQPPPLASCDHAVVLRISGHVSQADSRAPCLWNSAKPVPHGRAAQPVQRQPLTGKQACVRPTLMPQAVSRCFVASCARNTAAFNTSRTSVTRRSGAPKSPGLCWLSARSMRLRHRQRSGPLTPGAARKSRDRLGQLASWPAPRPPPHSSAAGKRRRAHS